MGTPTTDLRTALTKLAEKWDASVLGTAYARELRALLAAHPAPAPVSDTRPEGMAAKIAETHWTTMHEGFHCVGCGWRDVGPREDYGHAARRHVAEVALAVPPAPPVVDEAEVDAVVALAAREMLTPGSTFLLPHERAMVHHVGRAVAAHMRGTTRG